jgi:hypothetical protein
MSGDPSSRLASKLEEEELWQFDRETASELTMITETEKARRGSLKRRIRAYVKSAGRPRVDRIEGKIVVAKN